MRYWWKGGDCLEAGKVAVGLAESNGNCNDGENGFSAISSVKKFLDLVDIFRSTLLRRVDLITWVRCLSVRPSVHKKFFQFRWNSKSISSAIFNESWQMTTDSDITEQYLTFVWSRFLIYVLVFVSRDFELGRVSVQFANTFAIAITFARWRRRSQESTAVTYGTNFCFTLFAVCWFVFVVYLNLFHPLFYTLSSCLLPVIYRVSVKKSTSMRLSSKSDDNPRWIQMRDQLISFSHEAYRYDGDYDDSITEVFGVILMSMVIN